MKCAALRAQFLKFARTVLFAFLGREEPNRSAWRFLEEEKVMVTIKVKDGTPHGSGTLCSTCRWAHIVKGYSASEKEVFCTRLYPDRRLPFPVSQCTTYDDKRIASKQDMEKIAWILITKTAGRSIGFVTAAQFRQIEGEDAEILPAASIEPKLKE